MNGFFFVASCETGSLYDVFDYRLKKEAGWKFPSGLYILTSDRRPLISGLYFAALIFSVSSGTNSRISATTPTSAIWKIGALAFLLTATI